jgi:hypothetical protein
MPSVELVIVAARCDMGGAPLCAWQPQLEYPLPRLTQNPLRHPLHYVTHCIDFLFDFHYLLTTVNVQRRVLTTLGRKRQARRVSETLSLGEYLANRGADMEATPREEDHLTDDVNPVATMTDTAGIADQAADGAE